MKLENHFRCLPVALGIALMGCASYTPSLVKLDPSGPSIKKAVSGDLTLYVDEYGTPEKSRQAFDTDMANENVLPLLISVENGGRDPYEVKTMNMIVRGDNVLKGLTPAETAGKAERNPVGRALGWSLIVPIISIPIAVTASAIHTSKVNEQIVHDLAAKSFADGEILPNKERSGFVFFELGDGSVNLAKLTLEVEARNVATGKLVKIVSPLPERVIKAKVSEGSEDGAEKTRNDDD